MSSNSRNTRISVFCTFLAVVAASASFAAPLSSLTERSESYRKRYGLKDTSEKLTRNHGKGYEDLYGTRNFRMVLAGVLYRGGANNLYHREHPRDNRNPLPNDGLQNLCEEGFDQAIYLYPTNFSTAPKETRCKSAGAAKTLNYQSLSPFGDAGLRKGLELVYLTIQDPSRGPVYAHCWNGWHASGLFSATALIQFCGITEEQALSYWNRNTDGVNGPEYDSVRKRIRAFKSLSGMRISEDIRHVICPNFNGEWAEAM